MSGFSPFQNFHTTFYLLCRTSEKKWLYDYLRQIFIQDFASQQKIVVINIKNKLETA